MNAGFVGIGSMGEMLVRTLLRSQALVSDDVWASNRSKPKLEVLAADFPGIHIAPNREIAQRCELVFLCVGASETSAVLSEMSAALSSQQLLLTIAASIPLNTIEGRVPCRVARVIPSITQEIGAGIVLLTYGSRVTTDDRSLLEHLLGRISRPVVISETMSRPVIGLASGGPALLAYLLQSMAQEAVRNNAELSHDLARTLVLDTASATLKLIGEGGMTTEEIIR